jgi:hypothetical protein
LGKRLRPEKKAWAIQDGQRLSEAGKMIGRREERAEAGRRQKRPAAGMGDQNLTETNAHFGKRS